MDKSHKPNIEQKRKKQEKVCNMQGNCSCLRARLLYSKGGSSPGVLSARESGNHVTEMMIYLVPGMS